MAGAMDYIIVGGGLTGCVVASRIKQSDPDLKVLLIEAGPDASDDARTHTPMGAMMLGGSELDWSYRTTPQRHLNNRTYVNTAGKALGGGSTTNYGGWLRGDASDYDDWGKSVGDQRWTYEGLLPYFKKSESHCNAGSKAEQHGDSGPMHITPVVMSDPERKHPLRDSVRDAWLEIGVKENPDDNDGDLGGISEIEENWHEGRRQPSHLAYSLSGVSIMTDTMVQSVTLQTSGTSEHVATGVRLLDGTFIKADKEVILTAGAFRTPQLLMLSGIGPPDKLERQNIDPIVPSEAVGNNLYDHFAHFQYWKLSKSDLAMGGTALNAPAFAKGFPQDWVVKERVPTKTLQQALTSDAVPAKEQNALLDSARVHVETLVVYAPAGASTVGVNAPMDGSHIASSTMLLLPTSRGSVTLSSGSIADPPVIDPNYYATATDRAALIHGTKRTLKVLLGTKAGRSFVEREVPPSGFAPLTAEAGDEEVDARIKAAGVSHAHPAGTAAMGKVVDGELRVKGVKGLRVADASILPVSIGGHPQATLYAVAEQAAEMIMGRVI